MSGPLLTAPPLSASARAAAAGEVALVLGRRWWARELAAQAIELEAGSRRAHALADRLRESGTEHGEVPEATNRRVPWRVSEAYRAMVEPTLSSVEAAATVGALMERGRRRARPSRRHREESLPPGSVIVVHHRRPDVGVVVRDGRATALRLRRRARHTGSGR